MFSSYPVHTAITVGVNFHKNNIQIFIINIAHDFLHCITELRNAQPWEKKQPVERKSFCNDESSILWAGVNGGNAFKTAIQIKSVWVSHLLHHPRLPLWTCARCDGGAHRWSDPPLCLVMAFLLFPHGHFPFLSALVPFPAEGLQKPSETEYTHKHGPLSPDQVCFVFLLHICLELLPDLQITRFTWRVLSFCLSPSEVELNM